MLKDAWHIVCSVTVKVSEGRPGPSPASGKHSMPCLAAVKAQENLWFDANERFT